MTADMMQGVMPWLLGATILLVVGIVALVFIGRAYAPDHIHEAVEKGNVVLVRWFVLVRPDVVNAPNTYGRRPLHWAGLRGHASVVDVLLAAGADTNAKDANGCTPLHWAAGGNASVVDALLTAGADANPSSAVIVVSCG